MKLACILIYGKYKRQKETYNTYYLNISTLATLRVIRAGGRATARVRIHLIIGEK